MKESIKSIVDRKWFQEAVILIFAFVLFTMNDWILIISWKGFWKACCYFMILYTHAQLNRFFLLPVLFKKHKPVVYIVLTALLILVFAFILHEVATVWLYRNCFLYKSVAQRSYLYHVAIMATVLICIMGPILLFTFYREHKQQAIKTILSNQIQLNALKSQLNPHFLFNTLNTLYGISLAFPDRTPDLIMKVSQLMRYQVENSEKDMVSLEEELTFIQSYIELEKERVGHRCAIQYKNEIENSSAYKIAPMLLITFVENAFKHGTCTIEACSIDIRLSIENSKLTLEIINSVPTKKSTIVSNKIGITNTRERLEILYKDNYDLQITENSSTYRVHLNLQLI